MANETNFIDKLVDDEGLKFTVTANLAPDIYAKLFVVIAASVIISGFAIMLLKNAFKN